MSHGNTLFLEASEGLIGLAELFHIRRIGRIALNKMDFEREMQKALKVIFQNIEALEDNTKVRIPTKLNYAAARGKPWQNKLISLSLSDLGSSMNASYAPSVPFKKQSL